MKTQLATLLSAVITMGLASSVYAGANSPEQQQAPQQQQQQAPQGQGAAPAQEQVPTDFSDSEIEKFVAAQDDLETIRQEYSGKLEGTEDPDKAAELQQEASEKMVTVVQDEGLDVETYSNIALAVQSDPELREKVEGMM